MLMGCGSLSSATVWLNTPLRRLLPPNVNPKTQERWQPPPVPLTGVSTACPSLPVPLSWFRWLAMMYLPCMSLAQDVRYIYHKLLFAVVSVVGHVANPIFQENLSLKFLSTPAKSCRFPWPSAFQGLGWPTVNPRMTFYEQFEFSLFFALSVLNESEYVNIRPCRKVLIMLFGVMLSSMIIFDSAAPSWPWISRQTVRYTSLFRVLRGLLLLIKAVQPEYFCIYCIYLLKYVHNPCTFTPLRTPDLRTSQRTPDNAERGTVSK